MTNHFFLAVLALVLAAPAAELGAEAAELHRDIEYGTASGESLKLDASVPAAEGPFPVAILIHGGGWGGGDKSQVHVPPTEPLDDKFTWFSIDYRLAPAHHWPACIDDVREAVRWVKEHAHEYKGDPERIVVIGYSAGGHLAAYAATATDEDAKVQGAVIFAGPTDLVADCERRGGVSPALQALLDREEKLDDEARAALHGASPTTHLHANMPPFLLIHGTLDESVLYNQSENLKAQLDKLGVPCELVTIPGGAHDVRKWKTLDASYEQKLVDWLQKTLAAEPVARGQE